MPYDGPVTRHGPRHHRYCPGHNGGPHLDRRPAESVHAHVARERILDQLAKGKPNRGICRAPGMPSSETIRCWRHADPEFARQFAFAQQCGWDWLADDLVARVDEACRQGNVARASLFSIPAAGIWPG